MNWISKPIFFMFCAPIVAVGLRAQPKQTTNIVAAPVFGELMVYEVPNTFDLSHPDLTRGNFYIHELVPTGQTVDRWREMITATATLHAAVPPKDALAKVAAGFQAACPGSFFQQIHSPERNDKTAYGVFECGEVNASQGQTHSEIALYVVMEGKEAQYTFQWASRGKPTSANLTLNTTAWEGLLNRLRPRLCPLPPSGSAPVPCSFSRDE